MVSVFSESGLLKVKRGTNYIKKSSSSVPSDRV